jgi:hypothetical protein
MTLKKLIAYLPLFVALILPCQSQPMPEMRIEEKFRIREASNILKLYGEMIWTGIKETPFSILLVTDSIEYLVNHPSPSEDFTLMGNDSILSSKIYFRKAVFNKHFLATFPAVNGINTIVVGTPENTKSNSSEWIITLLHEHFHQYANSSREYYTSVNQLDLSGGDKTGMWMLNYPFPYTDSTITLQYKNYTHALLRTLSATCPDSFEVYFKVYVIERERLQHLLKPADYRYFSFQIWQEGIARYTEYKFLELLDDYEPSKEILALPDFISFRVLRQAFYKNQVDRITNWNLSDRQRQCFYALGFSEGLILDRLDSKWTKNICLISFTSNTTACVLTRRSS